MAKKKVRRASKKSVKSSTGKNLSSTTTKWHAVPLKGSFMVLSMLGFLISAYLVTSKDYKTAFMLVFGIMFVASLVSMTKAPIISK